MSESGTKPNSRVLVLTNHQIDCVLEDLRIARMDCGNPQSKRDYTRTLNVIYKELYKESDKPAK
jgi:hypothetical protein